MNNLMVRPEKKLKVRERRAGGDWNETAENLEVAAARPAAAAAVAVSLLL